MRVVLVMLLWAHGAFALGLDAPLPAAADEARARALFTTIRCVICAGESIADSPAQVAADMRRNVREQIAGGKSDAQITGELVSHYGDSILMRPPLDSSTGLLWFGPGLILLGGAWFARRIFKAGRMIYSLLALVLGAALYVLLAPLWHSRALEYRVRKRVAGGIVVFFSVGTFGMYAMLGAPRLLPQLEEYHAHMAQLHKDVAQAAQEIQRAPQDLGAWVKLGQTFMEMGQFQNAIGAFKQAVMLSKGNPLVILAYASALISQADGAVTDEAKMSLDMVLLQQPQNPEARYLMAVWMLQNGKTQQAMKAMKELYHSLPENSPVRAMLDKQIGRM